MRRTRRWALWALVAVVGLAGAGVAAEPEEDQPAFTIRQQDEQVVLYSIHRGPYEGLGGAIGQLYGLAMQNGMVPAGPLCTVMLNNPGLVSADHYLTEIRIPVSQGALSNEGTLGGYTDVKTVKAMEVAVAHKPVGVADPGPIYAALSAWIAGQGYVTADMPMETCLNRVMSGDYSEMKMEIAVPVEKQAAPEQAEAGPPAAE